MKSSEPTAIDHVDDLDINHNYAPSWKWIAGLVVLGMILGTPISGTICYYYWKSKCQILVVSSNKKLHKIECFYMKERIKKYEECKICLGNE